MDVLGPFTHPVIEARDTDIGYDGLTILRSLQVSLYGPGVIGLLGPNGSGKSTLLKSIVGMAQVQGGELRVLGLPAGHHNLLRGGFVGYLSQMHRTCRDLTIWENLTLSTSGMPRRRSDITSLLETEPFRILGSRHNTLASALSSGQRLLLALLMLRVRSPKLLLLDEPLAGLDSDMRPEVSAVIKLWARDKTVLLVDQDSDFVRSISKQILNLVHSQTGDAYTLEDTKATKMR